MSVFSFALHFIPEPLLPSGSITLSDSQSANKETKQGFPLPMNPSHKPFYHHLFTMLFAFVYIFLTLSQFSYSHRIPCYGVIFYSG